MPSSWSRVPSPAIGSASTRRSLVERRLDVLKREMADRLLARPAGEVYDVS
jgi:hypothetical protein